MWKKFLAFVLLLLISGCFRVEHRENIIRGDLRGAQNGQIKLNGYYYREFVQEAFPYYKNNYGGYSAKKTEPYQQLLIEPLILNSNGTVRTFYSQSGVQGNSIFNFDENCGLADINSTESAKEHFECLLNKDNDRFSVWGKGVFQVKNRDIRVQYYINWRGDYYLQEKKGKLLSDTTFLLTEKYDYKLDSTYIIAELYKFQKFENKPDSINYITKHPRQFSRKD